MKASIVDLRYRVKDVLEPLKRKEKVRIQDHPFFGMNTSSTPVAKKMAVLRRGRHCDL